MGGGFAGGSAMCNAADVANIFDNCNCCLDGDGLIEQKPGIFKKVAELQSGDHLQAMSGQRPNMIIETDVIMIMHRVSNEYG